MSRPMSETEFDMVCTTLQEAGQAAIPTLIAGSEDEAIRLGHVAAQTIGLRSDQYDVKIAGSGAVITVRAMTR